MESIGFLIFLMFLLGVFVMAVFKNGHPLLNGASCISRLINKSSMNKAGDLGNALYFSACLIFICICLAQEIF